MGFLFGSLEDFRKSTKLISSPIFPPMYRITVHRQFGYRTVNVHKCLQLIWTSNIYRVKYLCSSVALSQEGDLDRAGEQNVCTMRVSSCACEVLNIVGRTFTDLLPKSLQERMGVLRVAGLQRLLLHNLPFEACRCKYSKWCASSSHLNGDVTKEIGPRGQSIRTIYT